MLEKEEKMECDKIKEKILEEIAKTEKQITSYRQNTKPVAPDNAIGRISRMDSIVNKSVLESSLTQAENRLIKLRYALSMVDSPDFGTCVECGEDIPVGRILIMPETTHCVKCAE